MELKHLNALVVIVDEGTFRGAARRLGISQPSLSQQIGRLEDQLGVELFDRQPDGAVLTVSGELLYARAQQILGMVDETRDMVRDGAGSRRQSVSVAAIPTIAPFALPRAIRLLRDRFPDVAVELSELTADALIEAVSRGRVDVGVLASVPDAAQASCAVERVGEEPLVLAMLSNSEWAARSFLCAEDLQEAGMIVLGEMDCLGGQVAEFCAIQSVQRVVQIQSGQISTLIELVRRGVGVAMLPATMIEGHETDGLAFREVKDGAPKRPICTVRHPHRPRTEIATALAECVREVYRSCDGVLAASAR